MQASIQMPLPSHQRLCPRIPFCPYKYKQLLFGVFKAFYICHLKVVTYCGLLENSVIVNFILLACMNFMNMPCDILGTINTSEASCFPPCFVTIPSDI